MGVIVRPLLARDAGPVADVLFVAATERARHAGRAGAFEVAPAWGLAAVPRGRRCKSFGWLGRGTGFGFFAAWGRAGLRRRGFTAGAVGNGMRITGGAGTAGSPPWPATIAARSSGMA